MNMPGRAGRQWRWRLLPGQLTAAHARRLRRLTGAAGRLP
jgi:4-alpha-glucanotransferase